MLFPIRNRHPVKSSIPIRWTVLFAIKIFTFKFTRKSTSSRQPIFPLPAKNKNHNLDEGICNNFLLFNNHSALLVPFHPPICTRSKVESSWGNIIFARTFRRTSMEAPPGPVLCPGPTQSLWSTFDAGSFSFSVTAVLALLISFVSTLTTLACTCPEEPSLCPHCFVFFSA